MDQPVLVLGEALTDLIESREAGDVVYRPRRGGSPLNVAIGLRRLRVAVEFVTALGRDTFGRDLRDFLTREGVGLTAATFIDSGSCIAVATNIDGRVRYEYFGDFASMTEIRPLAESFVAKTSVVHAGSTAFNADPAYSTALAALRVAGPVKTIDPNPRPFLIENQSEYKTRLNMITRHADLVKLSGEDAEFLYPDMQLTDALHAARGDGQATVIMTRAGQETALLHGEEVTTVALQPVQPVDPTGAGDSFMAWTLRDILANGLPGHVPAWHRLIREANAAAAITCGRTGGAESMPTLEEVIARDRARTSQEGNSTQQPTAAGGRAVL